MDSPDRLIDVLKGVAGLLLLVLVVAMAIAGAWEWNPAHSTNSGRCRETITNVETYRPPVECDRWMQYEERWLSRND